MKSRFKIYCFLVIVTSLVACNATKRVPENTHLLTKVTVFENDTKTEDAKVTNFIQQQPNGNILGVPFGLYIYNLGKENPEKKFEKWLERHPKWHRFLNGLLSEKQVGRLKESFLVSGIHNQLKSIGDAPVILDSSQTKTSVKYLKAYYKSIGYFNAKTTDTTILNPRNKKKTAHVSYHIETGPRYTIDSLSTSIASTQIDSLYQLHKKESTLQIGAPYQLSDFSKERSRLNELFRNNGFYTFQQSSINFDIKRDTLIANNDQKINVTTTISNLIERDGDIVTEKPYVVHNINKIRIFPDHDFSVDIATLDTLHYKNTIIYYKDKLRYRPSMLVMASALRKGDIYSDEKRSLTYKQINNLRIFKYPNIEYKYAANDTLQKTLDANIYLVPLDKFSFKINADINRSDIQDFGIRFGTSFISRNVFRGGESFELNLQGAFGSQQDAADNHKFFNISEVGGDIRLNIPRIWFFTDVEKIIPYSMTPQTTLVFGVNHQNNIGLDKRNFNGAFRYVWNPSKNRSIFEVANVQYVRNLNANNFFNVYKSTYNRLNDIAKKYTINSAYLDTKGNLTPEQGTVAFMGDVLNNTLSVSEPDFNNVLSIAERRYRLIRNDFILSSSFTYIFNQKSQFFEKDFSQFRIKLESAGGLLNLFSNMLKKQTQPNEKKSFLGVEYAQFIKTELDFIKHWPIGSQSSLAFRSFFGIAIPYGNSDNVPFSQSYFAGGSNDNRGWRAYDLGPGSSGSVLDFNEANMKATLNLEYRFPIVGALKGAIFTDVGNIWNVFDNTQIEGAKFDSFGSLKDVGFSTGLGIRYDLGFFVLRLDVGNKTYNPALPIGERWISKLSMGNFVYNFGINYPF
ncbi:BamA/TamA family outer membrane protein [Capnocytophaga canimorsus]|uniref:translocation and assembly module lipoprotein TamL n=1 Tax=Capnocytophaga canimorsus TaxID=28188 RepID=UPI0037D7A71C